jgi:hypothetical protein
VGGLWRLEGDTPGPCGEFIAPNTTVAAPGLTDVTTATGATFTYTSTGRGTTFICTLDDALLSCPSTDVHRTTGTVSVSDLGPGRHTFDVAARDEAGNADQTPASRTWTIPGPVDPPIDVPTPPGQTPPTVAPVPRLLSATKSLRLTLAGSVHLRLGALPKGTSGTIALSFGGLKLATKHAFKATGKTQTVAISLTKAARRSLARHHRLRVKVTLRLAGGKAVKVTITLLPAAKRR